MKYAILILLVALSSCYTQRKAERQVLRAQAAYPATLASLCSSIYPPLEFTRDSFIYLPGKSLPPQISYVEVDCDSARKGGGVTKMKLPCPPSLQRIPDTIAIIRYTQAVNRAREQELLFHMEEFKTALAECHADIAVKGNELEIRTREKQRLKWWLVIVAAYLVAKTIIRIWFPKLSFFTKWLI